MGAATQGLSKVAHSYGSVSCVQSGFRPPCRGTGQAPYRSTRQALRRKDEVLFMDADISFNPFWIPAPVSGHGAGSVSGYGQALRPNDGAAVMASASGHTDQDDTGSAGAEIVQD